MQTADYNIVIFGLSPGEKAAVTRLCQLTRHRSRRYTVIEEMNHTQIHVALVDGDDPDARLKWTESPSYLANCPALLIARDPEAANADDFSRCLGRGNFAGRLIRVLDELGLHEKRGLSQAVIDDGALAPEPRTDRRAEHQRYLAQALVVDDSEVVRAQMQQLLSIAGLQVSTVESAEAALDRVRHQQYDIIFLDVELPGMDGYTACRRLRSDSQQADCPVVMLTSRDSAFDRIRGVMAGCTRYLTKPVSAENLYDVLHQYVAKLSVATS
ncbi:MAG: hypothetical protein Tsb002_15820 [Wenzhouxiangellaceae bacterium]